MSFEFYNNKNFIVEILKGVSFVSVFFLASSVGTIGITLSLIVLMIFGLSGNNPVRALVAFLLVFILVSANPIIISSKPLALAFGRYLSLIILLFKAFQYYSKKDSYMRSQINLRLKGILIPLLFFCAIAAFTSLMHNWYVHISILKIGQYFTFISIILLAKISLSPQHNARFYSWVFSFVSFLIFGSLLLYLVLPDISYHVDRYGNVKNMVAGLLYHSQALGVISAMSIAMILIFLFKTKKTFNFLFFVTLLFACLYLVILSKTRTALAATLFVSALFFIKNYFFLGNADRRHISIIRRKLNIFAFVSVFICLLTVFFYSAEVTNFASNLLFKHKGSNYNLGVSDIMSSRQNKLNKSWSYFLEKPIFGLGFGVDDNSYFIENASFFSAPTEKSFLPTAILHELGIVGTLAFLAYYLALIQWGRKNSQANFILLLLFFTFLNLGEFVFFSIGGPGAFGWLVVISGINPE